MDEISRDIKKSEVNQKIDEIKTPIINQSGQSAEGKTTATNLPSKDVDMVRAELIELKKDFQDLKEDAGRVSIDFDRLENRMDRANNFMMWVAGGIIVIFFTTGVLIAMDYFKNNRDIYEKFIDQVQSLRDSSYSKDDLNPIISQIQSSQNILNCLKDFEYFNMKCFTQ
jgi:hypothetical protein